LTSIRCYSFSAPRISSCGSKTFIYYNRFLPDGQHSFPECQIQKSIFPQIVFRWHVAFFSLCSEILMKRKVKKDTLREYLLLQGKSAFSHAPSNHQAFSAVSVSGLSKGAVIT